jgi:hypothetical protein
LRDKAEPCVSRLLEAVGQFGNLERQSCGGLNGFGAQELAARSLDKK